MTHVELSERLAKMSTEENKKFKRYINGFGLDDERIVQQYLEGIWVEKICAYFGVPTQADRTLQASLDAARFAKRCVWIGILGIIVAIAIAAIPPLLKTPTAPTTPSR